MKKLYVLAFVVVLFFISDCFCERDPDPKHYWVVCSEGKPALTDGHEVIFKAQNFNPSNWDCPKPESSPIWQGSQRPVYSNIPLSGSNRQLGSRAASPSSVAYVPRRLLDLPFLAQPSSSDTAPPCDSFFPDVIQVNHNNSSVNRIGGCDFQPRVTIPVVSLPLQIAITPDGLTALVTSFDNAVNFIDLASNKVTFTLKTDFLINPHGIAINSDGTRAYITSFNTDNPSVQVIDLTSRKIIAGISVTAYPQSAFLTPDDSQLYVTFPFGNAVYVIDTLTNTVANTLSIMAPRGLAFNSKGTKAFISSAAGSPNTIQVLNTNTFHVDTVYPVGLGPTDVAVLYGDQFVIVNNYEGRSISTIDTVTGAVQTTAINGSPIGLSVVR